MRQVLGVDLAEAELHHLHPRQVERRPQLGDVRGDHPEVLGNDRKVAQGLAERCEQPRARARLPAAVDRGALARRHRPVPREPAEVVDPDEVGEPERRAQPLDPPREPVLLEPLPAVERVPPQLPGGAEVVGRHARHRGRLTGLVEQEEVLVGPDVGAVEGNVDRDVAENGDAAARRLGADPAPLPEEQELDVAVEPHLVGELCTRRGERGGAARAQLAVPALPLAAAVAGLERRVQRPVVEPRRLLRGGGERRQLVAQQRRRVAAEVLPGAAQQRLLPRRHRRVVDALVGERGRPFERRGGQEALLDQLVGGDQQRVAGERRRAAVGGVVGDGGAERQHLPDALAGGSRPGQERRGGGAEVADPEAARQRGGVEQEPSGSR